MKTTPPLSPALTNFRFVEIPFGVTNPKAAGTRQTASTELVNQFTNSIIMPGYHLQQSYSVGQRSKSLFHLQSINQQTVRYTQQNWW